MSEKFTELNLFSTITVIKRVTSMSKLQMRFFTILSLLFLSCAFNFTTSAQTITFETPTYTLGNINGQDGWSKTGPFDSAVSATTVPGFGSQALRISNAITSGSFGDQTFSKSLPNEAGEISAVNNGLSGGTRQNYFEMEFNIASAVPGAQQPGLSMSVSPDRGDGARMSYLRFEDQADGIHVFFADYIDVAPFGTAVGDAANGCDVGDDFTDIDIATLDRTIPHTIKFVMSFVNGSRNDVVQIFVDGILVKTGTSWEDYFRYCEGTQTRTVDSLLFRTAGTAVPANLNNGFLFDNFTSSSSSVTAISLTPAAVPTALDNDYTRINNAVQSIASGGTITLNGTFNWVEPNAAASWALGSDGQTGGVFSNDDYGVLAPLDLNGVTFTASSLGAATIQGPGDLAGANLEGVLQFYAGGNNQNWTISNIRFVDFDNAIGYYHNGGPITAYSGTQITNNYILTARDLNATVAPIDVNQNIGIHFAFGTNQTISGNTIEIHGDGVSAAPNFSTEVAMQSNTSGGSAYNGLQITNNIVRVLNAQDNTNPQVVLGIWENAHGHSSNINVSGNQFLNPAGGNNPAVNLQRAFRVTSHSSATTTVTYANNTVEGANIGFQWLAGGNFAGNLPVRMTSNVIRNNATGVLVQSQGLANLKFNRIVGNSASGVQNVDGSVDAENNWWGCNYGPGAGGAGCAGTANGTIGTVDANPWLVLRTSATPNSILTGGTSNISSNLNFNSNNVDTSGSGSVPNGTPASFAGTLGTVAPPTGTTTSGVTGTTYTAGITAGSGNAATTIDGQTVNAPITIAFSCNNISIPTGQTVATNTQFLVPINIDDTTTRGILGYSFSLTYDPAVVTPIALETAGTLSNGWSTSTNNAPGTLNVVVFNPPLGTPLTGAGILLNVRFVSTGAIGTSSALGLTNFLLNEGVPCAVTTNGSVTIISGTISGTVTYANATSPLPIPRPVPNTTLTATGLTPPTPVSTDANGLYSMSGFSTGAYTITPSKTGQVNGIANADATAVAQHIVGFITLNPTQLLAADVTQNGTITSLDATYIAQYVALIPNPSATGTWRFVPSNRSYPNVQSNQTNQDYGAVLLGEVTGNWNNLVLRPGQTSEETAKPVPTEQLGAAVSVNAPANQFVTQSSAFDVNLVVSDTTGEGIFGYEFNLLYEPSVILPQVIPCDGAGTVSAGRSIVCNPVSPGFLRVVVFSTSGTPLSGTGTLLKLKFNAIGVAGNTSPLTIQNFMFNEGVPQDTTTNGQVQIVAPTSAQVSLGGQLFSATGQAVAGEVITLTRSNGETLTVRSSSFGFYQFDGLTASETYTISVNSKRHTFTPQTINLTESVTSFNLFATP